MNHSESTRFRQEQERRKRVLVHARHAVIKTAQLLGLPIPTGEELERQANDPDLMGPLLALNMFLEVERDLGQTSYC